MQAHPETERLLGDVLRFGVVRAVDQEAGRCTVELTDELTTGPVRWICGRAGDVKLWSPLTPGEQGLLLCPEGDIAAGVFLPGIYSDANPPPAADGSTTLELPDGSTIVFDPAAHQLAVTLAAGGKLHLSAPGGAEISADVAITGDVTITGKLTVSGDVEAAGDVKASGKSLKTHKHTAVQTGSAISGPPQ